MRIVLYEGEGAATLAASERCSTLTALLEKGYAVTCAGEGLASTTDGSALLVHALHTDDPDAVRDDIKNRYERRLLEIFS